MAGNDGSDAWGSQRTWRAHQKRLVPTRNRALSERNPTTHVESDLLLSEKRLPTTNNLAIRPSSVKMVRTYLRYSCSHAVSILEIRRSSVENSVLGDETTYLFWLRTEKLRTKGKMDENAIDRNHDKIRSNMRN